MKMPDKTADRDRYTEAASDLAEHIGDKVIVLLRSPENQARIYSILDPIVSHIINRVFPYILLSAILFLILFIYQSKLLLLANVYIYLFL